MYMHVGAQTCMYCSVGMRYYMCINTHTYTYNVASVVTTA